MILESGEQIDVVHINKLSFVIFLYIIKMRTKTTKSVQSTGCPTQVVTSLKNWEQKIWWRWKKVMNVTHLLLSYM